MNSRNRIRLVDRLHFRIAFFAISTILVIFGLYSAYQLWSYQRRLTLAAVEASEELCQTLTSSLEIAMLNNDLSAIQYSFDEIARRESVTRVLLLNRERTIRASSQRDLIGHTYSLKDPGCRECHGSPRAGLHSVDLSVAGEPLLRVVSPVVNKPVCHSCHEESQTFNGILILDRSMQPARKEIVANVKLAGAVAVVSGLLMMFLFRWYIRRQIINRVVYLESLARRVVQEQLGLEIEVSGRDELASLAHSVNHMRESLKQSIESIDGHRSYLAHLLENLTDGILILGEDDRVAFINKAVSEILGIPDSALRPGDPLERLAAAGAGLKPVADWIESARSEGQPSHNVLRLSVSHPGEKYLEMHTGRLELPPRSRPELMVIIRDITTRVDFERQVYQSEKLVTVGRLAAGVAHEINNPMASILTCAEGLLRSGRSAPADQREYLHIIRNSARRCKIVTQKLLDYAAAPTLVMVPVPLGDVLKEALDLMQFEATRRGVRLTLRSRPRTPEVMGSKDALIQVFVNLILNSLEAVETDGYVEVEVVADTRIVDVFVHDNGSGIAAGDVPRVFDPFFTTKPSGTSSGLGLSVSQGIIKQHHGAIEIVKHALHRTSIRVSLPAAPTAAESTS